MQKLFNKILVPVTFNRNTRWSVHKAIQFANRFDCDILLLHATSNDNPFSFFRKILSGKRNAPLTEIKTLEQSEKKRLKNGLRLETMIREGSWQHVMKDVIIAEKIDLAVIPKSKRRWESPLLRWVNINKLSEQTLCPFMTVTREFNINQLHNIVVPVHKHLPVRKLSIATYLSMSTSGCIFLMGGDHAVNKNHEEGPLFRAYHLLNEVGKLNIRCTLRDEQDIATDTLAYAKDVHADLIVVHPGKESICNGWWNKISGKYLSRESDIPVMTVSV